MPYGNAPPKFTTHNSRSRRLVDGLKDYEKPSECLVFQANPDGSKGELLRIVNPTEFHQLNSRMR